MGITVIIPTFNRQSSLLRTIKFILKGNVLPEQIIIVDQSDSETRSNEGRHLIADMLAGKMALEYIHLEEASLTHARNIGLCRAVEDIIVFMDDDVDIKNNTFQNIKSIMKSASVAMIAGIDDNTPVTRAKLGYLMGTKSIKNHAIGHVTHSVLGRFPDHEVLEETPTQWAMGFFFVVRKPLLDQWGLWFDENLKSYAYAEDLDFTYRYYKKACENGMKCILSPQIRVVHNASREGRISDRKTTFMQVAHRIYLRQKWWPGRYKWALNWAFMGLYFYKMLHHDNLADYRAALFFGRKYKRDIEQGQFHYELWE